MNNINIKLLAALDPSSLPQTDPSNATIKLVLQFVFALAGIIALLIISLSSLHYVLSRGDQESIKKAKNSILYAVVGLAITMSAYGIVTFVFWRIK